MSAPATLSLFDARPFFEKALFYGVQHGIINPEKLQAIQTDAPKGMVQIARYFGSEYLRPELERAKDRLINLVSLHLEHSTGGDLHKAAELLRDHSFLSRSKAGSDMLKALIAMPQNSHFGMHVHGGFQDDQIPLLAQWSLRSLADYRAELAARQSAALEVDAALWMAQELDMDADALEEAAPDAQAVIRTALLALAHGHTQMPDWTALEKIINTLRRQGNTGKTTAPAKTANAATTATPAATTKPAKSSASPAKAVKAAPALPLPKGLPPEFRATVQAVRESVLDDLPKLLDAQLPLRKLLAQTPAFLGRYFWLEDALAEVDQFDREASAAWNKATAGHSDDGSLLTLFLCIAADTSGKTLLTTKAATALVRKIRKSGLQPALAERFIADNAPAQLQGDYLHMWAEFLEEAQPTLQSDHDYQLHDALALLRRECNVV